VQRPQQSPRARQPVTTRDCLRLGHSSRRQGEPGPVKMRKLKLVTRGTFPSSPPTGIGARPARYRVSAAPTKGPRSFAPCSGSLPVRANCRPLAPQHMVARCHDSVIIWWYKVNNAPEGESPVAARRAQQHVPDPGDAGIYREGHRASSKAKPRRDATSVLRSSERLICRCRGQIGPESDGAAPTSTRSHKASGHSGTRRGWSRYAFCSETHQRAS
jgi:hypothetical protein